MNLHSGFPHHLQWTPDQIVDAVPLRLFELFAFDANALDPRPTENAASRETPRRSWHHAYLRPAALPAFVRIHS
jgi:hypothetical protein